VALTARDATANAAHEISGRVIVILAPGASGLSVRGRVRQRVLSGLEALMNRDFAYLLLVLAIVDRLHWFLRGAAIGSYAFAALFIGLHRAGQAADHAVAG
jgi:hypothetical protein